MFEKGIKQPTRERVKEIINKHQENLHLKPYNIANDRQKQSIAMAYLSEVQKREKKAQKVIRPRALSTQSQQER